MPLIYLDHSVYPDLETDALPDELTTDEEKADYLERICAAWDFDVYPEPETFALLRGWREIADRFPLPYSPAYHTLRHLMGWPAVPFPAEGVVGLPLTYQVLDRAEGRGPDPCEHLV